MITTLQALAVSAFAVLPGALYLFSYERIAGAYGVNLADRLIRFFGASAVFQAVLIGGTYALYRSWIQTGALADGRIRWLWVEIAALVYLAIPIAAGSILAKARKNRARWAKFIVGPGPEPRAWDFVWQLRHGAIIRMKMKSGQWIAGTFGTYGQDAIQSYASGYPDERGDLFLANRVELDPASGAFRYTEGREFTIKYGIGILVRWDEIEFLERIDWS